MTDQPLTLVINLSVLEDLGINLYGNVPAVLAEMVANAWDADATTVHIEYDETKDEIVVRDNGIGMTRSELQDYYLTVGHKRRLAGRTETPELHREPMGRKGIGKLSAFSIAEIVEVETIKSGEKTAIRMNVSDIRKEIQNAQSSEGGAAQRAGAYKPEVIVGNWDFRKGTRIRLRRIRKQRVHVGEDLRRRLARRFFVLGSQNKFEIYVLGKKISAADRGYVNLLEYAWTFGLERNDPTIEEMKRHKVQVENVALKADDAPVRGWIGTVRNSGALSDSDANAVVLIVRGKLAVPDILSRLKVGELATKYLVGEIHADFLDKDNDEDIATSDRQGFLEEDDRFQNLIKTAHRLVREAVNGRKRHKESEAEDTAVGLLPPLADWLKSLSPDRRDAARNLMASINSIYTDDDEAKKEHFRQAIIAHQVFDARGQLKKLEEISGTASVQAVLQAFNQFDQYEAALYYGVASVRVEVIRALRDRIATKKGLEGLVRDYLAEHLWLLDPSWDRATEPVEVEKTVKKYLDEAAESLPRKQRDARFDIVYRKSSTRNIIVELKRYGRKVTVGELVDQISKYSDAMVKALTREKLPATAPEIVCLIGPDQEFLETESDRQNAEATLRAYNGRIMTYDEMISNALRSYSEFLNAEEKKNALVALLQRISSF